MTDDYYGKNLFGETVDVGMEEADDELDLGDKDDKRFNIFLLTDAVGVRDKRNAWIIYRRAIASGMSAEEIFWRVMWVVKSMLLASRTKDSGETDMKPFPYNKAKSFLKDWKREELEALSEKLVVGYHEARRGRGEIETLLEKAILAL